MAEAAEQMTPAIGSRPLTPSERKFVEGSIAELAQLKSRRTMFDNYWRETAELTLPQYENTQYGRQPGQKTGIRVFDTTAIQSNIMLASALHGMLTSPSSEFFGFTTGDPEIDADDEAREWMQDAVVRTHGVMNSSNFQTEVHELYLGMGAVGTWTMRIEEDDEFHVRFHCRPIWECWIAEDYRKFVNRVYRVCKMSLSQIEEEFGVLDDRIKRGRNPHEEVEVLHVVRPSTPKDKLKGHEYLSAYIMMDGGWILERKGFREFPYVVPRWSKISGEEYGRGPGMNCLPSTKMVNRMAETTIKGGQKAVDPPILVPDDGMILPIKSTPGGVNFKRAGSKDSIETFAGDTRVDFGIQLMELYRKDIHEAFFVDQLQLGTGPQMTATEVNQRTEEKLRLMGPILGRLHFEFLAPMINRVFNICMRRGVYKDPPEILQGREVKVKFSSQIAKAQRLGELTAFTRLMNVIGPVASVQPEIMDNIDGDNFLRGVAEITGTPQRWLRKVDDRDELRDARAEANQDAQDAADAQAAADVTQKTAMAQQASAQARKVAGG